MNLLLNSLLVSLSFSALTIAQDCKAIVNIKTNQKNAELFLNDTLKFLGGDFILELEPGTYSLELVENSKKWNAQILKDSLDIDNCDTVNITYHFKPQLLLNSTPQNVYVYKSDSLSGFTPILLEDDFQKLHLKKPAYSDLTLTRNELNSGSKPELIFIGEYKTESFYESTLLKILAGTLIALGATTAYYKLEADQAFEEYQITGDPALQQQTEKYDLISGVTFVAMQINFGLILYLFLTD
jgi:hypothetical protein